MPSPSTADHEPGRHDDAVAVHDPAEPRRGGVWRSLVAGILVVVAAVLAPLAVVASWAEDQVGDTDRYLATVSPLADDADVQDAVVQRITTEITDRLDVEAVTREAIDALAERGMPPRVGTTLASLAAPLEAQVRSYVEEAVGRLVRSEEFALAWVAANREAHSQMVGVLTGQGGTAVDTRSGVVSVNLATVIETVKERLVERGFALASTIPEVQAEFTIFESPDVARAQTAFRVLGALASVLPWLALAALAGAVAVAARRRRALAVGALAVAASMVVLGLALDVVRLVYLDAVPPEVLPAPAATAVFEALVHFVRLSLRSVLVLFLAIAVAAWVTGPGTAATAVRQGLGRAVEGLRSGSTRAGLDTGRFGSTLHQYRTQVRSAVLGGALLVYVMAAHPTGRFTAVVVGVALLVLLVLEVLARPEPTVPTDPTDRSDVTGAPTSGA